MDGVFDCGLAIACGGTAFRIRACGFFPVEIVRPETWTIRMPEVPRIKSPQEKAQLLRWAATSRETKLGTLKLSPKDTKSR